MNMVKRTINRIMILKGGSPAIHQIGNIGRKEDDYIRVYAEDNDEYIGVFEEGYGFIDVRFKKSDCRNINKEEFEFLNMQFSAINNTVLSKITIDKDGNIIEN